MSLTPSSADHRWDRVSAKDHARVHNGHSYGGPVYNVHNYAPNRVDEEEEERREKAWRADLLTWLTFAEIDDRRAQVKDAYAKTFRWVFDSRSETGFIEWLTSGHGIFWINGKPGSGKSTLMKFITGEPRLQRPLQEWTGSSPLVISSFWFWAAGTPLQRSLVGIYRTLLVQILKTDDRLYRIAFPDWQTKFSKAEPTMETLFASMKAVLRSKALSTNFFFIIDGLDEYDRHSIGKAELAALMLDLTKCSRVKCLLSSRPETPFKIAFRHFPCFRLETLTKSDILAYVKARLWSNPSLREISATERRSIQDIGDFVIKHADGVFLWVALVMNIALDSINNYEDFSAIRDRIMELPPELDDMFKHIITRRIEHRHREEAFRYLLIALRFEAEVLDQVMDHTILAAAGQVSRYETACRLVSRKHQETFEFKLSTRSQRVAVRRKFANLLVSRCQGLLECTNDGGEHLITFCHKTLFDYLNEQAEARGLLASAVGSSFDLDSAFMVGLIHKAWSIRSDASVEYFGDRDYVGRRFGVLERLFHHFNMLAEACTGRHRSELVEAFDRCFPNRAKTEIKQLVRGKSISSVGTHLHPKICLLASAAYIGGTLHLKNVLQRFRVSGPEDLTIMLYYAAKGIEEAAKYRAQARPEQLIDSTYNTRVCSVLIEQGADPSYDFHGLCPWRLVLESLGYNSRQKEQMKINLTVPRLRLLHMFAHCTHDVRECREILSGHGNFEAVQMLVLRTQCRKHSKLVQNCQCHKAQTIRSLISETLQLLCDPRVGGIIQECTEEIAEEILEEISGDSVEQVEQGAVRRAEETTTAIAHIKRLKSPEMERSRSASSAEKRAKKRAIKTTTDVTYPEHRKRSGMEAIRRAYLALYRKCLRFISIK